MSDVRVARLPGRFEGKTWPEIPNYIRINASSSSRNWSRGLSPMYLGPLTIEWDIIPNGLYPEGIYTGFKRSVTPGKQTATFQRFEAFWQSLKVYNIHVDANGYLTKSFFEKMAEMMNLTVENSSASTLRRSYPKKAGYKVLYSYWNGKNVTYLKARLAIYCPYYTLLVRATSAYAELYRLLRISNLLIIDPDGLDIGKLTDENLEREVLDPSHPFSHSLCLASILLGKEPWVTALPKLATIQNQDQIRL